jgi:triacylglycerol lipase
MKTFALGTLLALSVLAGCAAEAEPAATDLQEDDLTAVAPLGPEPRGVAVRYPIVLAHGFLGSAQGLASFHTSISEALSADGHAVHRATVPPFGSVRDRARALGLEVDRVLHETGAKKVNLVAHSMGGLDARELVSTLGYGDRVASVTTLSTPHRGTHIADVSLRFVAGASDDALDGFAKLVGRTRSDVEQAADVRGALTDLSERNAEAFNAAHPDDPRVHYQSWAGVSSLFAIPNAADAKACESKLLAHAGRADLMHPLLAPAAPFVAHGTQPNDGFVLVSSAKWGNFRGCIPADHADEIGAFGQARDTRTGFDLVRFHRNLAFDLAARGF